jgi:hypothetical protein
MSNVADEERKWRIDGVYSDGKPARFYVLAFDHADAKKKAAKKTSAKITSVVLADETKGRWV